MRNPNNPVFQLPGPHTTVVEINSNLTPFLTRVKPLHSRHGKPPVPSLPSTDRPALPGLAWVGACLPSPSVCPSSTALVLPPAPQPRRPARRRGLPLAGSSGVSGLQEKGGGISTQDFWPLCPHNWVSHVAASSTCVSPAPATGAWGTSLSSAHCSQRWAGDLDLDSLGEDTAP